MPHPKWMDVKAARFCRSGAEKGVEEQDMTSEKKIEANRRNARKSTGPRTPEGKAAVRLNALTHGLLSQEVPLPEEDADALRELDEGLRAELQPVGVLENMIVDRIIALFWRLRRSGRVEVGIFAGERKDELTERADREAKGYEAQWADDLVATSAEMTTADKEKYEEARARARQLRSEQEDDTIILGRTFARDADKANAFSKLSRYETAIDRQLYRALHELERWQRARTGGDVPAPRVVDVNISGLPEEER